MEEYIMYIYKTTNLITNKIYIGQHKKKVDLGVTIDTQLFQILDEYLLDNNISNRSKYIEKLIREDFERRGKNIEREF